MRHSFSRVNRDQRSIRMHRIEQSVFSAWTLFLKPSTAMNLPLPIISPVRRLYLLTRSGKRERDRNSACCTVYRTESEAGRRSELDQSSAIFHRIAEKGDQQIPSEKCGICRAVHHPQRIGETERSESEQLQPRRLSSSRIGLADISDASRNKIELPLRR
jgi:hypothetical protein